MASNFCNVQYQLSQCTHIPVSGATWGGKHRPMITRTCTTTAESAGRDARAKVQYLLNTVAADFLWMGDVLQRIKPAEGGLTGGGLSGFDARCYLLSNHVGRPPVRSLVFCDLHPRVVNLNYPDLEGWPPWSPLEASVHQVAAKGTLLKSDGFGDAGHQLRKSCPFPHPFHPVAH